MARARFDGDQTLKSRVDQALAWRRPKFEREPLVSSLGGPKRSRLAQAHIDFTISTIAAIAVGDERIAASMRRLSRADLLSS